jgi:hypothetical protein
LSAPIEPLNNTGDFCWLGKNQDKGLLTSSLFRKMLQKSLGMHVLER